MVLMFLGRVRTSKTMARCSHGTRKCVPSLTTCSFTPDKRSKMTARVPPLTSYIDDCATENAMAPGTTQRNIELGRAAMTVCVCVCVGVGGGCGRLQGGDLDGVDVRERRSCHRTARTHHLSHSPLTTMAKVTIRATAKVHVVQLHSNENTLNQTKPFPAYTHTKGCQ